MLYYARALRMAGGDVEPDPCFVVEDAENAMAKLLNQRPIITPTPAAAVPPQMVLQFSDGQNAPEMNDDLRIEEIEDVEE